MTTEAGRALLEAVQMMLEDTARELERDRDARVAVPLPALVRTLVPRIEAEAVAAERERITAEVGAIEAHWGMVERPTILAIVNPEAEP